MKIRLELGTDSYDILLSRGSLGSAWEFWDLDRKIMIVTDSGVPVEYAEKVKEQCAEGYIYTFFAGEASKSLGVAEKILAEMLELGFSRKDAVVAVGGGVVGDLAGFCASLYMRGIDFYNIPTTVLAAVDSSIGGKVAVNFGGVKNAIGAFYQPKAVLIDPGTLDTLPKRQIRNGLVEALKAGAVADEKLFKIFEKEDHLSHLDEIILRSLEVKKAVVEKDPKENGLRRILNFGHTVGHGIESAAEGKFLHGECVALGMLAVSEGEVRERLLSAYRNMGLEALMEEYRKAEIDCERIIAAMSHDKKSAGGECFAVTVEKIGESRIEKWQMQRLYERIGNI